MRHTILIKIKSQKQRNSCLSLRWAMASSSAQQYLRLLERKLSQSRLLSSLWSIFSNSTPMKCSSSRANCWQETYCECSSFMCGGLFCVNLRNRPTSTSQNCPGRHFQLNSGYYSACLLSLVLISCRLRLCCDTMCSRFSALRISRLAFEVSADSFIFFGVRAGFLGVIIASFLSRVDSILVFLPDVCLFQVSSLCKVSLILVFCGVVSLGLGFLKVGELITSSFSFILPFSSLSFALPLFSFGFSFMRMGLAFTLLICTCSPALWNSLRLEELSSFPSPKAFSNSSSVMNTRSLSPMEEGRVKELLNTNDSADSSLRLRTGIVGSWVVSLISRCCGSRFPTLSGLRLNDCRLGEFFPDIISLSRRSFSSNTCILVAHLQWGEQLRRAGGWRAACCWMRVRRQLKAPSFRLCAAMKQRIYWSVLARSCTSPIRISRDCCCAPMLISTISDPLPRRPSPFQPLALQDSPSIDSIIQNYQQLLFSFPSLPSPSLQPLLLPFLGSLLPSPTVNSHLGDLIALVIGRYGAAQTKKMSEWVS